MLSNFLLKAEKAHGSTYNYSKVNYINSKTKITIICPIHGEFEQLPVLHTKGRGCQKCAIIERTKHFTKTVDSFIKEAIGIHDNKYTYENAVYTTNKTKLLVTCPTHGDFLIRPDAHLHKKHGCSKCANKNVTTEEFINKANKVHNFKYNYSKIDYTTVMANYTIICPEHGEFNQIGHNHLNGNGCQMCGEKRIRAKYLHEPTILYLLYLPEHNTYKIGITLVRSGVVNRYRQEKDLKYQIIQEVYFLDGKYAYLNERYILNKYKKYQGPSLLKGGNTELLRKQEDENHTDFTNNVIHDMLRKADSF